ncbi:hypothetical protein FH972_001004 [Carpinus fangiana]|uniref:Uncharacterized protein n=1 Tax=Carpinus fangiana TaxID=176857 RepID=A0A5N6QDI3_9ROSI|nr:hypothetical protein FH972_001004 [Carpinus fangiana]
MEEIELTNSWINSFIKFCIKSLINSLTYLRLECGLKQCEEVLEQIGEGIMTLKKTFPAKVGLKDVKMMDFSKVGSTEGIKKEENKESRRMLNERGVGCNEERSEIESGKSAEDALKSNQCTKMNEKEASDLDNEVKERINCCYCS